MARQYKKWVATLATAAILAVPGVGFATNGMNDIGVGAKSKGMGGVGIALPQDSFAAAINPAGMVRVGCRYDLGLGYVFQNARETFTINGPAFSTAKSNRGLWFPEVAFNWNYIPCQSLGLTAFIYGAIDTKYGSNPAPQYQFYSVFMTPSWSWQVNCAHSLGVAINVAWNRLRVSHLTAAQNNLASIPALSLYPNYVTDRDPDWELGVGVRVGWIGQITRCFAVGATFQSKTWMAKFKKYQGLNVNDGDYDLPAEAGVGFSWKIFPCLTLAFDFIDRFWTTSKTFDHNSRQPNGVFWGGGVPVVAFGTQNGVGFGWRDQPIFKVGVAYNILPSLTVRAGYNHGCALFSATETMLNILTQCVVQDHVTVGGTWSTCCGELSAYYYHGFKRHLNGLHSGVETGGEVRTTTNANLRNVQNGVGVAYGARF